MEKVDSFSQILMQYFMKRGSVVAYCKQFYPNDNIKNKARVINRYITGERVPSFEDADEILTNLGEKIKKDDLIEILEKSKNLKYSDEEFSEFCSKIKIRYSEINKKLSIPVNSEELLTTRINNLGVKNIKEYIVNLIIKDIEENVL